jgi:hypothetical protein
LNVSSPNSIAFETTGAPPGLEILNLGSYNSSEPPRFFELVDSVPKHNTSVSSFSGNFEFIFSEAPIAAIETGPLVTTWISENVEISPPVSFDNFMNVNGNSLSIAPMSLPPFVTYTLKLKPGIKAASGLSLTERSITFTYNPL